MYLKSGQAAYQATVRKHVQTITSELERMMKKPTNLGNNHQFLQLLTCFVVARAPKLFSSGSKFVEPAKVYQQILKEQSERGDQLIFLAQSIKFVEQMRAQASTREEGRVRQDQSTKEGLNELLYRLLLHLYRIFMQVVLEGSLEKQLAELHGTIDINLFFMSATSMLTSIIMGLRHSKQRTS